MMSRNNAAIFNNNRRFYQQPGRVLMNTRPNVFLFAKAAETSSILLQSVIEFGERVADGDIIIAVLPAWDAIISLLNEDPSLIFKIDPRKLEEIIAASYEKAGYEVTLTPRSGDFGRDVIAVKRDFWSIRILDQVKAYGPDHVVTANDVRAMAGVLSMDHNASKGVVTTTSRFAPKIETDPFIQPLVPHRLQLIDGAQLIPHLTAIANAAEKKD